MKFVRIVHWLLTSVCFALAVSITGCVTFEPVVQSKVEELDERPCIAVLPFTFDLDIAHLSAVKTVDDTLSSEDESKQLAEALYTIKNQARWLFLSRLATGGGFRFISTEEVDRLAEELQLTPGVLPNAEQLATFRRRLGADLVISTNILDYGKIRWQWLLAGMFVDITWETVALGLASSWNPVLILGNLGFELLTSTPLWFGGGYLFGVSMRPVRVEMRALETRHGYPIWQAMDESAYSWGALKQLPESIRDKKEIQLQLNMAEIMESLGDNLTKQGFAISELQASSVER